MPPPAPCGFPPADSVCHHGPMAYSGNLTCRDCGLTFTASWGSVEGADEYRCSSDHVVYVDSLWGAVLSPVGSVAEGTTLAELRGLCPRCSTELVTGSLPSCPVCRGRDHDIRLN